MRLVSLLKDSKQALALLALGSCGTERERLDQYSDLDFFVIVKDDYKQAYIQDLTWLSKLEPLHFTTKIQWTDIKFYLKMMFFVNLLSLKLMN